MKFLGFFLISLSLWASNENCLLDGSFTYADDSENYNDIVRVFHGFEYMYPRTEDNLQVSIDLYNTQSDFVKKLIYTARVESDSTGTFFENNPPSISDIVSYMDYLAIDRVMYKNPKTQKEELLYRVDIAVGGGNGAYLYYQDVSDTQNFKFKKLYEDFDGDLIFCAHEYEL